MNSDSSAPNSAAPRYAFLGFWFVLVPATVALVVVWWCSGDETALGAVGDRIREQRIPAGIVIFTVVDMALYAFRHYLPGSHLLATGFPLGLERGERREYEAAGQLIEEAERLLKERKKVIERELPAASREKLRGALTELSHAMRTDGFSRETFQGAYHRSEELVDRYLAPWRKSELREYAESIGVAILIALALRAVVVEAFKIPSGSMLPTLQIDDHIFVNKFVYGPTVPFTKTRLLEDLPPARGDVIVFEFPEGVDASYAGDDFIKRVIALPGDVLEVNNGHPTINGWKVPQCAVGQYPFGEKDDSFERFGDLFVEFLGDTAYLAVYATGSGGGREGPFTVPPSEVYVMGDNRHNSHDSRKWNAGDGGGVPLPNIQGRAMSVWLPVSRMLVPVMGKPELPKGMPAELTAAIEKCLNSRPTQTLPPSPKAVAAKRRP